MLGESYTISTNKQWEQTRYLATILYNTNATKRSQMVKPEDLFKLPQDKISRKGKPKSTKEQYQAFLKKVENATKKIDKPLI